MELWGRVDKVGKQKPWVGLTIADLGGVRSPHTYLPQVGSPDGGDCGSSHQNLVRLGQRTAIGGCLGSRPSLSCLGNHEGKLMSYKERNASWIWRGKAITASGNDQGRFQLKRDGVRNVNIIWR